MQCSAKHRDITSHEHHIVHRIRLKILIVKFAVNMASSFMYCNWWQTIIANRSTQQAAKRFYFVLGF